jgi:hypothetical protein
MEFFDTCATSTVRNALSFLIDRDYSKEGYPMAIPGLLDQILSIDKLLIPKVGKVAMLELPAGFPNPIDVRPVNVFNAFGDLVEDHGDIWRVKCCHRCNPGASVAAITEAEDALDVILPEELRSFLRFSNGAELFVVPRLGLEAELPGTFHVRYKLLSTNEIVTTNRDLLELFRSVFGNDPGFRNTEPLNYLAFCDVTDGNYLALLLEGDSAGRVFHLDRELCGRPYTEQDSDMYYTLAESLEGWLAVLRDTEGWAGRGMMIGGF